MDDEDVFGPQVVAELPDRLQKRQALDVAHRAADLAENDVFAVVHGAETAFDLIGDVGNDLNGAAEVVPVALL